MSDRRAERLSGKSAPGTRNAFQLDRDRLLYSMAFRRLSGVTQVVSPGEGEIFHNRLTHTLKVAQIARRLAEALEQQFPDQVKAWGGLSPDVVESAALAHDLGHPPYGHIAEEELDHLVSADLCHVTGKDRCEGYEGNAQSFRIITELAVHRGIDRGLDLTRATLNATLKYPWKFGGNSAKPKKYGAFECDDAAFRFARTVPVPGVSDPKLVRCLEAQIMDWADDITYSVHDSEDFYRAGLIPLDRLAANPKERSRFRDNLLARAERSGETIARDRDFHKVFDGLFDTLGIKERYEGGCDQQRRLYEFISTNINKFVTSTSLLAPTGTDGEALDRPPDVLLEVRLLKELTRTYVIENPALAAHQRGQRLAIRTLFTAFNEAAVEKHWPLFPPFFRERAESLFDHTKTSGEIPVAQRLRLVADTIASLTDRQASLRYQQFTGVSHSSMLDPVIS
jgi:dGTPase